MSLMLTVKLTIVRGHLDTTDAQSVWRELSEHLRTSSKGASEKRRLTQYVTNTVPDDDFKGTTEQFVLHLNEQFISKLLSEASMISGLLKLLDEFQSTTHGHGSSTSRSSMLVLGMTGPKKANIGKRRNV